MLKKISLIIAGILILYAVAISTTTILAPVLNKNKNKFTIIASQIFHYPVHIQAIEIIWRHGLPLIQLDQVVVIDPKTKLSLLSLNHVDIWLKWWRSLVTQKVSFSKISIEGMALSIQPSAEQAFSFPQKQSFILKDMLTGAALKNNEVLNWILAEPELELKNIVLRFIYNGQNSLSLRRLTLKNTGKSHFLTGRGSLSQNDSTSILIRMDWDSDTVINRIDSAHINIGLNGVSLAQWLDHYPFWGVQITHGFADIALNATWGKNHWQTVESHFHITHASLASEKLAHPEIIDFFSGQLALKQSDQVWELYANQLSLSLNKHVWPINTASLELYLSKAGPLIRKLSVAYLDLAEVSHLLATSTKLTDAQQTYLSQLSLSGELSNLHVQGLGLGRQDQLVLAADLNRVSWHGVGSVFGMTNLNGKGYWQKDHGTVIMNSQALSITMPALFKAPLALGSVQASGTFQKNRENEWRFSIPHFTQQNADIHISGTLNGIKRQDQGPVIDLQAFFGVDHLEHIADYLPLNSFSEPVSFWLQNALANGRLIGGQATLSGELANFPFAQKPGSFSVSGEIQNAQLNYAKAWPQITNIDGTIAFHHAGMQMIARRATMMGNVLTDLHADIDSLGPDAVLKVTGNAVGGLSDVTRFIKLSPLSAVFGKTMAGITPSGPMQLGISLTVPLKKPKQTAVSGEIVLVNADVFFPKVNLSLTHLIGKLTFTKNQILAKSLTGKLFDKPITIQLKQSAKQSVLANLFVNLSLSDIEKWTHMPLSKVATGASPVSISLRMAETQSTIDLHSTLVGTALLGISPFHKTAESMRLLNMHLTQNDKSITVTTQLGLSKSTVVLQKKALGYQLLKANFEVDNEHNQDRPAITLTGSVSWVNDKLFAHLSTLNFQSGAAETPATFNPNLIPSFHLVIDSLQWNGSQWGALELDTQAKFSKLLVPRLTLNTPLMKVIANGEWAYGSGGIETHFMGNIYTQHLNTLLQGYHLAVPNLQSHLAAANFNVLWHDTPYHFKFPDVAGTVNFKIGRGSISKLNQTTNTKMELGKLLNLFSLRSLPRRLSFDFSDLVDNGYSFDYIQGLIHFSHGYATTQNLVMDGSIAKLTLTGGVNLPHQQSDFTVKITPYLTGSLPLVAALAGGPVAALATWAVNSVISHQVTQVATHVYHVSGPLAQPTWSAIPAA
jgi:uncharacterized protein YhdP